jgi:hypothetical protein
VLKRGRLFDWLLPLTASIAVFLPDLLDLLSSRPVPVVHYLRDGVFALVLSLGIYAGRSRGWFRKYSTPQSMAILLVILIVQALLSAPMGSHASTAFLWELYVVIAIGAVAALAEKRAGDR